MKPFLEIGYLTENSTDLVRVIPSENRKILLYSGNFFEILDIACKESRHSSQNLYIKILTDESKVFKYV